MDEVLQETRASLRRTLWRIAVALALFLLVAGGIFVLRDWSDPIRPNVPSQESWTISKPAFEAAVQSAPVLPNGKTYVSFPVPERLGVIEISGADRDLSGVYFAGHFGSRGQEGIAYFPGGPPPEERSGMAFAQIEGPWYATITTF